MIADMIRSYVRTKLFTDDELELDEASYSNIAGALELILFGASSDLRWNLSAGTLELIMFGARSDFLWYLRSPEIPSRGFLLAFPRWGLLCLFVRGELNISLLGFYYTSHFLGKYMYDQITLPIHPDANIPHTPRSKISPLK